MTRSARSERPIEQFHVVHCRPYFRLQAAPAIQEREPSARYSPPAAQVLEQRHDPEHQCDTDENPDQPPAQHHRAAEHSIPTHQVSSSVMGQRRLAVRKRSALLMTLTDDSAMAAAAIIGDSSRPKTG